MKVFFKLKNVFFTFLFLLNSTTIFSQVDEEAVADVFYNYFAESTETFHLQFSKNTFITPEIIWFKGFVFDLKKNTPFIETSNVHVDLFDSNGTLIEKKLIFSNNGTFNGHFDTTKNFKSGMYYIQVYTNWSLNFNENKSAIFKIEIINPIEGKIEISNSNPIIELNPESNILIENVKNNIGVYIHDVVNNGFEITNGKVYDDKNNVITEFQTNSFGYGKFEIKNIKNVNYKVSFEYNNKQYEKNLPPSQETGVELNISNYTIEGKTSIFIRTNSKFLTATNSKNLFLTINQNEKVKVINFELNDVEKIITLPNEEFFNGVNSIRIIDDNLKQLCERVIYNNYKANFNITSEIASISKDSLKINLLSNISKFKIGVSILPFENKFGVLNNGIFNSFLIKPYLKNSIQDNSYFDENLSRRKQYELDLFMLNQNDTKYKWDTMKTPPIIKNKFNIGLTLSGKINETLEDKKNYQVQMFSILQGIDLTTSINDKNEFYFEKLIAMDSTSVNFFLIKNGSKYKDLKYYPQVINRENYLYQLYDYKIPETKPFETVSKNINYSIPIYKNAVLLEDVSIYKEINKDDKLVNKNRFGMGMMKGKTITEDDFNMYRFVIPYLAGNGFDTGVVNGNVYIRGRGQVSLTRPNIPTVFLDDFRLDDFNVLDNLLLSQIEEIYIDKRGQSILSNGGSGVIKIYTKTEFTHSKKKSFSNNFMIENGFSKEKYFKSLDCMLTENETFKSYGSYFWLNNVFTEKNFVPVLIPYCNQKQIQMVIEGFSDTGEFISENRILSIR